MFNGRLGNRDRGQESEGGKYRFVGLNLDLDKISKK